MIVITGAAGFIGSCLTSYLNDKGREDLILCDEFGTESKNKNLDGKRFLRKIERDIFFVEAEEFASDIDAVFHLGARTDTTEFDHKIFDRLNLACSKKMWKFCHRHDIPLIYASSAATYGSGEMGYDDNENQIPFLKPLNPYGESKNNFDIWALDRTEKPPYWAGLKFFNIYGPNEYHKARMASVIFHTFQQIQKTGSMKLFRSHRPDFRNGEQKRDLFMSKTFVRFVCFWPKNNRLRVFIIWARVRLGLSKIWPNILSGQSAKRRVFLLLTLRRIFETSINILRKPKWANCAKPVIPSRLPICVKELKIMSKITF